MTLVTMKYVDNVVSGILRIYGKKKEVFISHYIHNVHSYSFLKNLAHIFFLEPFSSLLYPSWLLFQISLFNFIFLTFN